MKGQGRLQGQHGVAATNGARLGPQDQPQARCERGALRLVLRTQPRSRKLVWNARFLPTAVPEGSVNASLPPRLSRGGAGERSRFWWLAVPMFVALGFWLLRWGVEAGVPLPGCGFRAATGLPCPGCGSTRALLALSGADVSLAWRFNPLATVLLLGAAVAGALWFAERVLGLGAVARFVRRSGVTRWAQRGRPFRRWAWGLLAVVTLLNWSYLLGQGGSP